jgi:hypothetical protein
MSGLAVGAPALLGGEAAVPGVGWVLLGVTVVALGGYLIYHAMSSANEHADAPAEPTQSCPNAPPFTEAPGNRPPFAGTPGSTVRGGTGSRTYGPDGYPQTNRDLPHPDEAGTGNGDHVHDWGRPEGGGPPTDADRGPPRLPRPGDPPPPRGPNVPPP